MGLLLMEPTETESSQLAIIDDNSSLQRTHVQGTHDSGAYNLSRRHMAPSKLPRALVSLNRAAPWATAPIAGLIAAWGEAQGLDACGQLRSVTIAHRTQSESKICTN